jgi:hypothetical protein
MLLKVLAILVLTALLTSVRLFVFNMKRNKLALLFFVRGLNVRDVHIKSSFRLKDGGKTPEMDILISHHETVELMSRINVELIKSKPFPNLEWRHKEGKKLMRMGLHKLTREEYRYLKSNIEN